MMRNQRSTRRTHRLARALAIAAAPALLGMGLVTAGVAQAGQDQNLASCSWPDPACGPQANPAPGGQTNLNPGRKPDHNPGPHRPHARIIGAAAL
ncbi:hypothetical protein [Nocardia exalbida]|uniref:hypothetical protein n=1 Tax=Nocardia exalbida TaxID=290231 RepID=UPI000304F3EE|nr:hypothetical protein [Nocardia exalbida]